MTTVGFIGSGRIGSTVAHLAVAAGHQVVLSNSRGPQTLGDLVSELGPLARAATAEEAASGADLVLVSIPVKAYPDISRVALTGVALTGKVVMDTGNYSPARRDGQIAELDGGALTSSEWLEQLLTGASVVKVFNNIYFKHLEYLSRPSGAADRSFLPIAGDDPAAKDAVTGFLDEIGYGAVDAGPLAEGWRQQPGTPVYGAPYGPFDDEKGTPAAADVIRAALAAATRS
ncbi:MAG TPA: NAD(P)-binding domain-containing protein [Streptosporangiaceae bacterium]|nr:NAD(P)-binding domain-containing protein [Streptosporangiaceae bacterium]